MVHTERGALIDDLKDLDDGMWEAQSLCERWTVHDVVAHLVDTAHTTRVGFMLGLARAGFEFHRQNAAACGATAVHHRRRRWSASLERRRGRRRPRRRRSTAGSSRRSCTVKTFAAPWD
ncbi:maleylpyruvate isomerase N-terminal domain-containing protein [Geodermatophilus sp. CPCC 206100]|uniref:maleylpyruvate isomerase N-terminal domain-containing protein n=1 Tax=Geodermatophilus sp. CPCC 206100 TaxID=3020054 RepID=UPI003B00E7EC